MNELTRDDLQALAETQAHWCVSLLLPTHRKGTETQQDPIRLKNLLREAEEQLVALDVRGPQARELLNPGYEFLETPLIWKYQDEGLVLFLAPQRQHIFRLPRQFDEMVVVADRFHLKPLFSLLFEDARFYVLVLSQNGVRLLQGARHQVQELSPDNIPTSLAEALKYDDPELSLQHHSSGKEETAGGTMYHGQGAASEDHKNRLLRYFQKIDRGLADLLREESAPLILAGVDYYFPIYREANTYQHLAEEGISGNHEQAHATALHTQAWKVMQPRFEARQTQARDRFAQAMGTGLASKDLAETVLAARDGRVDTLFVARDRQCWGKVDPETRQVTTSDQRAPGHEDLLDHVAVYTFLKGGTVHPVAAEEVPGGEGLAAVFRY